MTKRVGVVVVALLAAAIGAFWFWHSRAGKHAPSTAAVGSGSAAVASTRGSAATEAKADVDVIVRTADGKPIAAAVVRLASDGGEIVSVDADATGTAHASGLEPGSWMISASAAGYLPQAKAQDLAGGKTTVELALAAGGRTLTGVVTDATSGPVGGARIDAARLVVMGQRSTAVASTLTKPDGTYTLTVEEGQLLVAASEPSYASQSRYVDVGQAGATANFALVPGGVIEGIVRDEKTREPVAGADVLASRGQSLSMLERSQQHATSGADGRFRLAGLHPGSYDLSSSTDARMSASPTTIALGVAEQVSDVEILVAAAPSIRGTVVDEHDAPVAGADVEVMSMGPGAPSLDAHADAKGAFVVDAVPPGSYELMGNTEKYRSDGATSVTVEKADVTGIKVRVRAGVPLRGHVEPRQVCSVSGKSIGAEMRMFSAPANMTGADGVFDLGPLAAGTYEVEARCPSGDQGHLRVTSSPGMADVIVAVSPGASITGRVVDHSNKPVAGVSVMAAPGGDSSETMIVNGVITSGIQALTAADGTFELRGLAAGPYQLSVLGHGRPLPMKGGSAKLSLADHEQKAGVTLVVDRPDGVIKGLVTGPDGKPLPDAWVSLHMGLEEMLDAQAGEDGPGSRTVMIRNDDSGSDVGTVAPALTKADGTFELVGLVRSPTSVIAEAKGGTLRGIAKKVTPDAQITIQVLGLGELRGTVKAGGAPPSSFSVELDGPTREQRSFASADGTFSFSRLDPGDYQVRVTSSAGNGQADVKVAAGQPASIEILLAANATVIGKLVDSTGKPLSGIPVMVFPDAGTGHGKVTMEGPPQTSGIDGTFRIETKAGPSGLVVLGGPKPTTKMGLVLEAGKTLDTGTITVEQ